jgi:signal transduction histidine kinase
MRALAGTSAKQFVAAVAVAVAAFEVFVDWDTWVQLNVSIVYGVPLVLAAGARSRRLLWCLAAVLIVATFVVYARQIGGAGFSPHEPFFINRVLASVTALMIAGLLHVLIGAFEALDARGRRAEEASGRKTRLLASVSHDLRTPLTSINLFADLIRRGAEDPSAARTLGELAEELQKSAASLSDLVADVLDISQLDSGNVGLHNSAFLLDGFIEEECRALEPLAAAKGLSLSFRTDSAPMRMQADRVKLGRVLRNLINNAIVFTAAGGISVAAYGEADGTVVIEVADTGPGIAPDDRERIFGEFVRLQPRGEHRGGWGLGLAISRRLVSLMGGTIAVDSPAGKGSVFTVRLPRIAGHAPQVSIRAQAELRSAKRD